MSERKPRYFQHESGGVYYATMPDTVADYENDRTMAEVQVVPVDAIVIRRDELPKEAVLHHRGEIKSGSARLTVRGATPEYAESIARHYLRLAEYLREHPPVDEEQVKALNDIYEDWSQPHNYGISFGQYLAERGVRVEVKS